ncbi:hypothetical protein TYRP_009687 [Tyrophagus putrescentiae]|nr:hypothetical protein TYRP_009687 [Tyrophagus putrescentiae]
MDLLPTLISNASLVAATAAAADAPWVGAAAAAAAASSNLTNLTSSGASEQTLNTLSLDSSASNSTSLFSSVNVSHPLPYPETPADIRQYLLIFRLVLLGVGALDTLLLLFVYVKCATIISSSLGVYVANLSIAVLVDLLDVAIWAAKEFGLKLEDLVYPLPQWVYSAQQLPGSLGLPTTSLLLALLLLDRLFATFFAGCHRGCFGFRPTAVVLCLLTWAASFAGAFVLVYRDLLFPHDQLYEQLRFLVAYLAPFGLKLLLLLVLFAKRKVVPCADDGQSLIGRQRESLYYALTILLLHLLLSAPYYALQVNRWYPMVTAIRIDDWMLLAALALSELPLVLNPLLCLSIDPEFRESLVYLCSCTGGSGGRGGGGRGGGGRHAELTDLCDDHGESQPLAPMATSPMAEEKEHLDEAEH